MAILKIKDSAGIVTEIASIKGTSGKSPIIKDGYWWNYNDTTKEYENTNISVGNILTVSDTEPDTDLWIDTSIKEIEPITITINDEANAAVTVEGDTSWIVGRRCLMKIVNNQANICYLDESNSNKFQDGTTAKLDGTNGDWMVELPEFYYLISYTSNTITIKLTNIPTNGWNRSDKVYLGATKGIVSDSKLRSKSGSIPTTGLTITEYHNLAQDFDIIDYESRCKIFMLYLAKYATRNVLQGFGSTNTTTGTTASLGNTDGTTSTQTSILGIEDLFGNIKEFTSGLISNNDEIYIFRGFHVDSEPTFEHITESLAFESALSGYVKTIRLDQGVGILPKQFGASTSTYYCDYAELANSGWCVAIMGGSTSTDAGLTYLSLTHTSDYTSSDCGSRLMYRGDVTVLTPIDYSTI